MTYDELYLQFLNGEVGADLASDVGFSGIGRGPTDPGIRTFSSFAAPTVAPTGPTGFDLVRTGGVVPTRSVRARRPKLSRRGKLAAMTAGALACAVGGGLAGGLSSFSAAAATDNTALAGSSSSLPGLTTLPTSGLPVPPRCRPRRREHN